MADAAKSAKLAAELTDEGDIRPLPFKASNTVGRGLAAAEKSIVPNGLCPLIRHGLGRDTFPTRGKASALGGCVHAVSGSGSG